MEHLVFRARLSELDDRRGQVAARRERPRQARLPRAADADDGDEPRAFRNQRGEPIDHRAERTAELRDDSAILRNLNPRPRPALRPITCSPVCHRSLRRTYAKTFL